LSIALIDVVFEWVIRTRQRVWGGENSKAAAWRVQRFAEDFRGREEQKRKTGGGESG